MNFSLDVGQTRLIVSRKIPLLYLTVGYLGPIISSGNELPVFLWGIIAVRFLKIGVRKKGIMKKQC